MGFDAEHRTYHQLNSKWKDMCTKLTKFSGIYSNCANNQKSGMSDENVLKWAEKEYQLKSNGQRLTTTTFGRIRGPRFFKKNQKLGIERVFAGVRQHIQITRLTSRMTKKKKPSSTTHRKRLDRWVEIKQNGLPLRVVKPPTLTRQQPSSPINSKLS
ncbi:hypothetical protein R6Q57_016979, partial [Mikania cordata]